MNSDRSRSSRHESASVVVPRSRWGSGCMGPQRHFRTLGVAAHEPGLRRPDQPSSASRSAPLPRRAERGVHRRATCSACTCTTTPPRSSACEPCSCRWHRPGMHQRWHTEWWRCICSSQLSSRLFCVSSCPDVCGVGCITEDSSSSCSEASTRLKAGSDIRNPAVWWPSAIVSAVVLGLGVSRAFATRNATQDTDEADPSADLGVGEHVITPGKPVPPRYAPSQQNALNNAQSDSPFEPLDERPARPSGSFAPSARQQTGAAGQQVSTGTGVSSDRLGAAPADPPASLRPPVTFERPATIDQPAAAFEAAPTAYASPPNDTQSAFTQPPTLQQPPSQSHAQSAADAWYHPAPAANPYPPNNLRPGPSQPGSAQPGPSQPGSEQPRPEPTPWAAPSWDAPTAPAAPYQTTSPPTPSTPVVAPPSSPQPVAEQPGLAPSLLQRTMQSLSQLDTNSYPQVEVPPEALTTRPAASNDIALRYARLRTTEPAPQPLAFEASIPAEAQTSAASWGQAPATLGDEDPATQPPEPAPAGAPAFTAPPPEPERAEELPAAPLAPAFDPPAAAPSLQPSPADAPLARSNLPPAASAPERSGPIRLSRTQLDSESSAGARPRSADLHQRISGAGLPKRNPSRLSQTTAAARTPFDWKPQQADPASLSAGRRHHPNPTRPPARSTTRPTNCGFGTGRVRRELRQLTHWFRRERVLETRSRRTGTQLKTSSSPSASTVTASPSANLPSSTSMANGSVRCCWMARLTGRAPKAGS